jgi:hypothetical protein
MQERIYRTREGNLVLQGIQSVGIENTVPLQDVYAYPPNGFPEGIPEEITEDVFWGAIQQKQREQKR